MFGSDTSDFTLMRRVAAFFQESLRMPVRSTAVGEGQMNELHAFCCAKIVAYVRVLHFRAVLLWMQSLPPPY